MTKFYSQRLGNAFVVGLGGSELIKVWFKKDGESQSVFTEEQAKDMAEGIVEWLREKYDESSFDDEEYGSSEENQFLLRLYDKMCRMSRVEE